MGGVLEDWLWIAVEASIYGANAAAPWAGLVLGWAVVAWATTDEKREGWRVWWLGVAATAGVIGPLAYFFLPLILEFFTRERIALPSWHLAAHGAGLVAGVIGRMAWMRWVMPTLNRGAHRMTRKSSLERNRRTDVRQIQHHLPQSSKAFQPEKWIAEDPRKKGMFIGLNEKKRPVFIPYQTWKSSHVQVIGTTGAGKGVASAVLLAQALRAGEGVFVLDPKNDEWAPHVLRQAAEEAGVPFHLIDLNRDQAQLDLLADLSAAQLEELFNAGFSLAEKGEAADFYRIGDRKAARAAAQLLDSGFRDLRALGREALSAGDIDAKEAKGFLGKLEELALLPAINAGGGLNLANTVADGGCVYIIGSMRNPRVVMAQRMLFVRLLQIVETRDRVAGPVRPVCVFLDEVKYHLSRPALEGLGAARDKGMHLILAHQSLGDLRDCPADLDPDAVVGAVVENCALRLAYRVRNPETAVWLAEMSGEILVDDEIRKIDRNAGGAELMEYDRTVRQATRYLIDQNMLLNLPDRVAVLYGSGLPQFAHISPITAEKRALEYVPAPSPTPAAEPVAENTPKPVESATPRGLAADLISMEAFENDPDI